MSAERASLATLIDSVADGTPIDWDALDAAAPDDNVRRRLRHLRLVARLAAVHGGDDEDAPADGSAVNAGTLQGPAPRREMPSRWGHLVLVEKIGEGSFGEVYHARDPWLDRDVALKLLRTPSADAASVRRLLREARTLARVRHTNVVTVYGADVHDGRVGIWMELLRGRTLEDRLAAQGPLSAGEAAIAGQEVCSALAAVHAAGLVHRDVKASNVMREQGGRHVLMDFGAGELRDLGTGPAGSGAGTPLYLAPELLRGAAATPQADLYAAGVLLYRLVTGSYPVNAESLDGLRAAHDHGQRARLRDVRPDLPDAFAAVVEKALDPDPRQRYATAGAMQEALSRLAPRPFNWIAAALAAAAVLVAAAGVWQWSRLEPPAASPTSAGIHRVAVLPLWADAGVDEDFAVGMTDAIIHELSALETIRVMPYTAVSQFKRTNRPTKEIVAMLRADSPLQAGDMSLIEGSMRRDGQDIRVNIRLVDAAAGTAPWSRTFHKTFQDVISLQQDIARGVAQDLPVAITAATQARWARRQTIAPQSFELYIHGRAFMNEGMRESIERALTLFGDALRLDARNSYALAATASAHAQLAGGRSAVPEKTIAEARRAANAALEIDPGSAEAVAVLAEMAFFGEWDWTAAEQDYRRALSLNPSLEYARERYSMYLAARGRLQEALEHIEEARRVNPPSLGLAAAHGGLLQYAGRVSEAAAAYQWVLDRDPRHLAASVGLGRLYNATGRFTDARAIFESLRARDPAESFFEGELAQALAGLGRRDEASRILTRLEQDARSGARMVPPGTLAYAHASLGQRAEALAWLERAIGQRSIGVLWLKVDPRVNSLRDDPKFAQLVALLDSR